VHTPFKIITGKGVIMKKSLNFLGIAVIAFALSGCASSKSTEIKLRHFDEQNTTEVEDTGRQYGEILFESIKTKNYEMFCQHLTPEAKESMTLKLFNDSCDKLVRQNGKIGEATFLGSFNPNPLMRNFIWKIEFEKESPKADASTKTLVYDRLFTVSLVKIGEDYQVIGFHIM
jgi:hypothetical protein